jgi:hypothetical protein
MLALLLMAVTQGAWSETIDLSTVPITGTGPVNIKFITNDRVMVAVVENVTLPHTFYCSYSDENGELDEIIRGLYKIINDYGYGYCDFGNTPTVSGKCSVTAGKTNNDHWITINSVFEGTAKVTGMYNAYKGLDDKGDPIDEDAFHYILNISIPGYVTPTITVNDGDVLTGTLDGTTQRCKIMIADGATVTLDNVTINGVTDGASEAANSNVNWAGLTCLGDATIILKNGTTNTVKGSYQNYPGIYVPVGKTLTIQGDGTLNASSNGGNSTNSGAPGIGAGVNMACGNIRIEGGTIAAMGGYASSAISDASFIVTKGDVAPYRIGASGPANGVAATCGTVTIDGTVYADGFEASPYRNLKLDEAADNSFALNACNGAVADLVTVKRTLVADSWNTFALPFDVDASKLAVLKMMEGVTVKELSSTSLDAGTLTLNFTDAMSIEAGRPYLVKVTSDFDLSTNAFPGATISKDAVPFTSTDVDFIPTLGKTLVTGPENDEDNKQAVLFVAANNELKNPAVVNEPENQSSYMKGFRAYFQLKNVPAGVRSFVLNIDGEATGITTTNDTNDTNSVYDLQGRQIVNRKSVNRQFSKGVYIQNGKKVVVK